MPCGLEEGRLSTGAVLRGHSWVAQIPSRVMAILFFILYLTLVDELSLHILDADKHRIF